MKMDFVLGTASVPTLAGYCVSSEPFINTLKYLANYFFFIFMLQAKEALDQFHKKDRANRKQLFYLEKLEHVKAG